MIKIRKKKAFMMAMIGAIIGIMLSIVFKESANMLAIIPVAGVLGGLIGTIIDRKKNNSLPNNDNKKGDV